MNPDIEPERYNGHLLWIETYPLPHAGVGVRGGRGRITDEAGNDLFEVDIVVDREEATRRGRPAEEVARELATSWAHGLIDLNAYTPGMEYRLSTTGRSPAHFNGERPSIEVTLLKALLRIQRWEEVSGQSGYLDPRGVSLVAGIPEGEVRELLADLKIEGVIEDSPIATSGDTASGGWARLTPLGRRKLREDTETRTWEYRTVVFTDIVGSTEMAVEVGSRSWLPIVDEHFERGESLARQHAGRPLKQVGDSLLVVFETSEAALQFATEFYAAMKSRRLPIRVGIHHGEVHVTENDVRGEEVHFAARVMHASDGPGILISEAARSELGPTSRLVDRGSVRLKGFPGEHRLFSPE